MKKFELQRSIEKCPVHGSTPPTNRLAVLLLLFFLLVVLHPVVFSQDNAPLGAALQIYESELYYDDWPEERRSDSILELAVVRDLLSSFDEEKGQVIIVRHPGGDVGKAWAFEFQGWLVSFGIPMNFIILEPGSGYPDALLLLIEQESETSSAL
ncbi:MAG: hypothetical protein CL398_01480 [Acidiferrobacteraceae bacterium]|nr:hypothetical protein [Acidiferrobacteraceae bacterium]|tara:strand:+ start:2507 stop:2968 length:462 start_codon:yes stop_codon:yes gene_type:complete